MNKEELINLTAVCGIDCFNCEFFHGYYQGKFKIGAGPQISEDKK
jgi:hypothetical protein